jgi:hypothetical protein
MLPNLVKTGSHTEPKICPVKRLKYGREDGLGNRIFVDRSAGSHVEGEMIRRVLKFSVSIERERGFCVGAHCNLVASLWVLGDWSDEQGD